MSAEDDTHFDHFVRTKLAAGENPIMFLAGWSDGGPAAPGCLVVTSLRACFCRKGEPDEAFQALALKAIHSAEMHSTPARRKLSLRSPEGDLVFQTDRTEEDIERLYHRIEALLGVDGGLRETVERISFDEETGWAAPPPATPPPTAEPKPASRPAPPARRRTSGADILAALNKLAELQAAGIVTAQEFEAKKHELLGRL